MNVAVVSFGLRPEEGGGHTFQQSILRALEADAHKSRHRFVFYFGGGDPVHVSREYEQIPSSKLERAKRAAIVALRDVQDRRNMPRWKWRTWFEKSLKRRGIEFVWFISHYLEECDQPFICTIWDLAHLEQPWFPEVSESGEWERRQFYLARYLPKATRIIVPNGVGRDVLVRNFPIGPERVMELQFPTPNFALAADIEQDDASVLQRFDITEPYLFYPAQFWAHKNHFTALETLRRLNGRTELSFQLVLVGSDKGQLEYVRGLAQQLGVADQVRFLGFVDTKELVPLYRHAHALLFLSFFGPENLPPLEALALRCPVVCADVPGMREQLGEAALFVPPTDPEAVGAQIVALLDQSVRRELTDKGRHRAEMGSPAEYVGEVIEFLDRFEAVRRCWA